MARLVVACLAVVLIGCGGKKSPAPQVEPEVLVPHRQPGDTPGPDECYEQAIEFVRPYFNRPETTVFANKGTVTTLADSDPEKVVFRVAGDVTAKTNGGQEQTVGWQMELDWVSSTNTFKAGSTIQIEKQVVYQSPEFKAAMRTLYEAGGNGFSDLPEDLKREIRNLQSIIEDKIKARGTEHFLFQWPDDPDRRELKARFLADDGVWEFTGKLQTFDGAPRKELLAHVSREDEKVVRLKLGTTWVVGRDPKPPTPEELEKARLQKERIEQAEKDRQSREAFQKFSERKPSDTRTTPMPRKSSDTFQPKEPPASPEDERIASNRLNSAESVYRSGKRTTAKKALEEIVEKYPRTRAAKKAEKALKEWN